MSSAQAGNAGVSSAGPQTAMGRALSAIAGDTIDSAAVGAAETLFNNTVTIRGGELYTGVMLRLWIALQWTASNGATFNLRLRQTNLAGALIWASTALAVGNFGANTVSGMMPICFQGLAAPGAAAPVGVYQVGRNNHNTTVGAAGMVVQPVAWDTTSDFVVRLSSQCGAAGAGNIVTCEHMWLERIALP